MGGALLHDPRQPRYRAIEHALRERVATLRPGDRLPSDATISAEFGVSRMTARNAFARLADEGLIHRDPGRGSFVAEPPAHRRANSLMSFTTEMRRRGRVPSSRVLGCEARPATDEEAAALRLTDDGRDVLAIQRIRLADGESVALETAVVPSRCAVVLTAADLEHGSLHEALAQAGIVPTRGEGTVGSEPATAEDASRLGVRPGEPLLVERRVIVDQQGRPMECTESRYPGTRYALDVVFEVAEAGR
jgi:GntR family transcriptional regulator